MSEAHPISFDAPLGRQIIELHIWAVRQGLAGAQAGALFDGFCRRLIEAGVPLWRGYAAMRTLHPQWGGYGYTWRRELNAIEPAQYGREDGPNWRRSPFASLLKEAETVPHDGIPWLQLRRRLAGPDAQLDFAVLEELAGA